MGYVRLFYCALHVLEVGTTTAKTHLNTLQEAGAHPLRGVCWHFMRVLLDYETQRRSFPKLPGLLR